MEQNWGVLEVELLPELADKPERVITLNESGLAMAALVPPLGGPSTVRLCQGIRSLKEPDSPSVIHPCRLLAIPLAGQRETLSADSTQ